MGRTEILYSIKDTWTRASFRLLFSEKQPLHALVQEERQNRHQHALEQIKRHDSQQHERGKIGDCTVDLCTHGDDRIERQTVHHGKARNEEPRVEKASEHGHNTSALINLLQMVYHNVKHYFQMQIDMQDVNQVLASHFNEFGQKVVEAYIRPLKIKDSVPKYRVPIQSVLRSWAEDDALLLAMANATLQDKRGDTVENCRSDLLRKIFWIDERYDNIEHDYLDEIDAQVRRYTRAATQKVENLTNRDQNVRGNLNVLLTALSRNRRAGDLVDQIQPVFQLYEQSFLSEKSLWYRKRPGKRTKAAAVLIQETASDADAAAQAAQLLRSEYGRAAIVAYVQGWLGDADVCYSKDLNIKDDKSYIMSLLAVLTSGDSAAGHQIKELGGSFHENGYSIPQMQIRRKEKKNGF